MPTKNKLVSFLKISVKNKYFFPFLIAIGLILTFAGLFLNFYERSILSFDQTPEKPIEISSRQPFPQRIIIDDLKINLSIQEAKIINEVWEVSDKGASHLDISANPNENGNIVVYGHNKKIILGSLPYIRMGTIIKIVTDDGIVHEYKVISKATVKPDDLSYVLPKDTEILTVYTCNGFLDTTRFIVQAKPI